MEPDLILTRAGALFAELDGLPEDRRIDTVNAIRVALHQHSPMKAEPVDCVLWVTAKDIEGNEYNPNHVAPPEMRLLRHSIESDGFTQPIVAWQPDDSGLFEVVDGFHRYRVGTESPSVRNRVRGRLPITVVGRDRQGRDDRVASTIRHNRARGVHQVDAMSDIVIDLARRNRSDEWIARELGMEFDEVLRLKQVSAMAELFGDREFSEAWEADPTAGRA